MELDSHDENGRNVRKRSGERLYPGERISLRITNRSNRTVYVALFESTRHTT